MSAPTPGTKGPPRLAIVRARFNSFITDLLLDGARAELARREIGGVLVLDVPGAWELPTVAARLIATGRYDAVVALGCVIRGATAHFDFVAGEAARGLGWLTASTGVPVIFGVLTTDTVEQALERADPERGDKGAEAVATALEMAALVSRIDGGFS